MESIQTHLPTTTQHSTSQSTSSEADSGTCVRIDEAAPSTHPQSQPPDKISSTSTEVPTSTRTRVRLFELEAALAKRPDHTSTRTRQRVLELEAELAKREATDESTRFAIQRARQDRERDKRIARKAALDAELLELEDTEIETEAKLIAARTAHFEKRASKMRIKLHQQEAVDVAICMDCTGSMSGWIAQCKQHAQEVVSQVKSRFVHSVVRMAFVAYRDHCDGDRRLDVLPFCQELDTFRSHVGKQRAGGGGDMPEDVMGAMNAALQLDWQAPTRIVISIGDAPCHGRRFHATELGDSYSDGDPLGLTAETLCQLAVQQRVSYFWARLTTYTEKMFTEFTRVYRDAGGLPESNLYMEVIDLTSGVDAFVPRLAETITSSIDRTMTAFATSIRAGPSATTAALVPIPLDPRPLDTINWSDEPGYLFTRHLVDPRQEIADIIEKGPTLNTRRAKYRLCRRPFAQGSLRFAYYAREANGDIVLVMKEDKHPCERSGGSVKQEMICQTLAKRLAQHFTQETRKHGLVAGLDFIDVSAAEVDGSPKRWMTLEPVMSGTYVKYTNNTSYKNPHVDRETQEAFSHWSFESTRGRLMLSDLQGVGRLLTDPCILSAGKGGKYGRSDVGSDGILGFFIGHHCGPTCRTLKLSLQAGQDGYKEGSGLMGLRTRSLLTHTGAGVGLAMGCANVDCSSTAEVTAADKKWCRECAAKVSISGTAKCHCGATFPYRPFYFKFLSLATPSTCKKCKASRAGPVKTLIVGHATVEQLAAADAKLTMTIEDAWDHQRLSSRDQIARDNASRRLILALIRQGMHRVTGSDLFGSGANGLASCQPPLSAIDISLVMVGDESTYPDMCTVYRLAKGGRLDGFQLASDSSEPKETFKYPMVALVDRKSSLRLHVTANNLLGKATSALLASYAQEDSLFGPMMAAVRQWAHLRMVVNTPSCGRHGMPMFGWRLMVVFFLQCLSRPVLPRLQAQPTREGSRKTKRVSVGGEMVDVWFNQHRSWPRSDCLDSTGTLLRQFFEFYDGFDWEHEIVSVAAGKHVMRGRDDLFPLVVADPFVETSVVSQPCCNEKVAVRFKKELKRAAMMLGSGEEWKEVCKELG